MRGEEGVGLGVKYIAKEKIGTIELARKKSHAEKLWEDGKFVFVED